MADPQLQAAMQQMVQTQQQIVASMQQLAQTVNQLRSQTGAAGDALGRTADRIERFNGDADQYSKELGGIMSRSRRTNIEAEKELQRYSDHINKQTKFFSQDSLLEQQRLRQSAIDIKRHQQQGDALKKRFEIERATSVKQQESLTRRQAYLSNLGVLDAQQQAESAENIRRLEGLVASIGHADGSIAKISRTLDRSATDLNKTEARLKQVNIAAGVTGILGKIEDAVGGAFTTYFGGLFAKGIKDMFATARAEIKTQGSLGGFFDKGAVSQVDTAQLGLSRPEFVQMAAEYRRTMMAMGGMNETVQQLKASQDELYAVTGDLKGSTEVAMQQFQMLANAGIRPTKDAMTKYMSKLANDYKDYGARTGQTLEQFSATIRDVNEDEATQQALRMAASEQERQAILSSNQARIKENVALGMTVQQATAAAKTLNKLAGEGPMERYKKSMKLQMAMGAMGIGGGAEAAAIYRKPQGKRTEAEKAQLQASMTQFENASSEQMGSADMGSAMYAEKIRGASGQSESDLAQFNTNAVKPMTESLDKNTEVLKEMNANMKGWVAGFKSFDLLTSVMSNAPWVAGLLGGMFLLTKSVGGLSTVMGAVRGVFGSVAGALKGKVGSALGSLGGKGTKSPLGGGGNLPGANAKGAGIMGSLAEGLEKISNPKLLIGVGVLAGLSGTLWLSAKALQAFADVEWNSVGKGIVTIGALAVVAQLMSKASPQMILGSVALGIMSLSMWGAGKAMQQFAGLDWTTIGMGFTTLIGLGVVGAVASLAAPAILVGAAALGAMGAAMWVAGEAAQAFASAFQMFANVNWAQLGTGLGLFGTGLTQMWENSPNPIKIGLLGTAMAGLGIAMAPLAASLSFMNTDKLSTLTDKLTSLSTIDPNKLMQIAKATKAVTDAATPSVGSMVVTAAGGLWDKIKGVATIGAPSAPGAKPGERDQQGTGSSQTATDAANKTAGATTIDQQLVKMNEANKYLKVMADGVPTLVDLANKQLTAMTLTDKEKEKNRGGITKGSGFSASSYQYL